MVKGEELPFNESDLKNLTLVGRISSDRGFATACRNCLEPLLGFRFLLGLSVSDFSVLVGMEPDGNCARFTGPR